MEMDSKERRRPAPETADPERLPQGEALPAGPGPAAARAAAAAVELPAEKLTRLTEANRQLKRKIFDLYTIFEISRNFSSVLNYQTLLDSFVLTCVAQVSASKGAIYLKQDARSDRFSLAKSKGGGAFPPKEATFPSDSKIADYLARLNRPVPTSELLAGFSREPEAEALRSFDPGLVVPLIYQSRLIGLVLIGEKIGAKEFGLDDIEFLSILGNQISVAIENARLYESERAATQQLLAAQQQLVHTERLAALGEMSARVAHEVNNPLGIIKNYLLLVQRTARGNVETGNYLEIISQEIDRIARIVRELLDFHRPEKTALRPMKLGKVIDDVLVLMDRQFEKFGIMVVREFADDLPLVMGSPENMKQVALNIVLNAADAMPNGGRLDIALRRVADGVLLAFTDTGPGIPPEIIPHIFEPFFTTKQEGKGTGLGLAVCYGIIKRHGGTITYKNSSIGGCFEIILPALEDRENHG